MNNFFQNNHYNILVKYVNIRVIKIIFILYKSTLEN